MVLSTIRVFLREEVEKQSLAASMMVVWVRAVFKYATARRLVKPTLDRLAQAQSRLCLLMQEYQASKQHVQEAEYALAKTNAALENAHKLRKQTVEEIESRSSRFASGKNVISVLQDDTVAVEASFCKLQLEQQANLIWWNAMITSGVMTYSPFFQFTRAKRDVPVMAEGLSKD